MTDYTRKQGRLRDHCIDHPPFPGALAIVYVRAKNEMKNNPALDSDKARPAVLSRQKPDGSWLAWGLTGNTHFQDGTRREQAPGLDQCGLQPGYLWTKDTGHVVHIPDVDVLGVVWAAPHELILSCATHERGLTRGQAVAIAWQLHERNVEHNWTWPKPETA